MISASLGNKNYHYILYIYILNKGVDYTCPETLQ